MRKLVFYGLSIVFIPFFLLGFFTYMLPVLLVRGKVSGTTYEPFNARLQWELLGLREDWAARMLARGLPATNLITRIMIFRLLALICRVSGYISPPLDYPAPDPKALSSMVAVRTEFFDRVMSESIKENSQVVIMGAGWDTRAYGLLANRKLKIFEVDEPATQQVKLQALKRANINFDDVSFASCDFNQENWLNKLEQQGFDRTKPTFLLWEGVSMYLDENAVNEFLSAVSALPEGSLIAFDFLPEHWWNNTKLGEKATKSISVTYGEKFTYFISEEGGLEASLQSLLDKHQLTIEDRIIQRLDGDEPDCIYGMVLASSKGPSKVD